jgi:hypothetical protein
MKAKNMIRISEIATQGFWQFIAVFALASMILYYICAVINRFFRHLNIQSKGWPAEHLDADGDFKTDK